MNRNTLTKTEGQVNKDQVKLIRAGQTFTAKEKKAEGGNVKFDDINQEMMTKYDRK